MPPRHPTSARQRSSPSLRSALIIGVIGATIVGTIIQSGPIQQSASVADYANQAVDAGENGYVTATEHQSQPGLLQQQHQRHGNLPWHRLRRVEPGDRLGIRQHRRRVLLLRKSPTNIRSDDARAHQSGRRSRGRGQGPDLEDGIHFRSQDPQPGTEERLPLPGLVVQLRVIQLQWQLLDLRLQLEQFDGLQHRQQQCQLYAGLLRTW